MAKLPDRLRMLIESGPLAHLVTLNGDGSPQVTIVWIGLDGDEIVSGHLFEHRKVRNIRRDPTVALSLEAAGTNEIGMQQLRRPLRPRTHHRGRGAGAPPPPGPGLRRPGHGFPANARPATRIREQDHGRPHRRAGALVGDRLSA